jgi:hypothetical protein
VPQQPTSLSVVKANGNGNTIVLGDGATIHAPEPRRPLAHVDRVREIEAHLAAVAEVKRQKERRKARGEAICLVPVAALTLALLGNPDLFKVLIKASVECIFEQMRPHRH